MPLSWPKESTLTLAGRLADIQDWIRANMTNRAKLVSAVRQAESEAQAETQLGNSYRTSGRALMGVSDEEVEVKQPRRLRDKLRLQETMGTALAAFDSTDNTAALRDEEEELHAAIEAEAEQKAISDDAGDAAKMLELLDAITTIDTRMGNRREDWRRRRPDSIGLHPGIGFPSGVTEPEIKTDKGSCLFNAVKMLIGYQHPALVDDDGLRAKIDHAKKAGFVSATLHYPSR